MAGYNFKDEKDVQEFLSKIFVEYSFGCYNEKNAEACHLLGEYHDTVKRNSKDAADIYKKNCDHMDFAKSCSKFGGYSLVGKGCEKSMTEAYKYLKKACALKEAKGCTTSGIMALSRPDIHNNDKNIILEDGVKVLDKACYEYKTEHACYYLAGVYITGIKDILERNLYQAYRLSLKACELGNRFACANVAQMHTKGEGTQKNLKMAESFRKRAAELEKESKEIKPQMNFGHGIPA